ncbi:MAG: LuxR C-terminal-related transcriptional regulator [Candidatus Zixiibacteriota bacterium]
MALPIWISAPDGAICYVNERAERLLGHSAEEVIGAPCFEVIDGKCESGSRFCDNQCPVSIQAKLGLDITPVRLKIVNLAGETRWIHLIVIPVTAPDGTGPYLVHLARPIDRAHFIEDYLRRVSTRSSHSSRDIEPGLIPSLTRRERDVLQLLAQDETLEGIAEKLHISYATVRNHVQRILTKLKVHSIAEAVARHLLSGTYPRLNGHEGRLPQTATSDARR